jgi:hypothetical protein
MAGLALLATITLFIQFSCKPTFSTTGPWRDTTIVYGLLDYNDTAHYIRIYKGYLDANINAYTQAKIPDSIYYAPGTITATLYQIDTNTGNILATLPLSRVDGNLEGFVMDTGTFATSPNILYKTKHALADGATYKLVIVDNKSKKTVYAQANLVGSLVTVVPGPYATALNFFPHGKTTLVWNNDANAAIYDLYLTLNYKEMMNGDTTLHSVIWNVLTNYQPQSSQPTYTLNGESFYDILANKLSAAPTGMTRQYVGTDFEMIAGGTALYTYYLATLANSGITQGQAVKGYTNIHNGVGLFSSRDTRVIKNLKVSKSVQDSLACYYPKLHFLNHLGKLCGS